MCCIGDKGSAKDVRSHTLITRPFTTHSTNNSHLLRHLSSSSHRRSPPLSCSPASKLSLARRQRNLVMNELDLCNKWDIHTGISDAGNYLHPIGGGTPLLTLTHTPKLCSPIGCVCVYCSSGVFVHTQHRILGISLPSSRYRVYKMRRNECHYRLWAWTFN